MTAEPDDDPIQFAPGVLEQLKEMMGDSPEVREEIQGALADMRTAHKAWRDGRYATFEEAMAALGRPIEKV